MENLKIRVNNADESKEIQNILESKGFKKWDGWSELGSVGGFIWTDGDMTYCDNKIEYFNESPRKETTLQELREMANPMKEYLEKQPDGTLELVLRGDLCKDDDIEVPEGMNYAYDAGSFIQFTKQEMGYRDSALVWQRDQDEPFLTPETTLNDQYAEIEQVRQAINKSWGSVGAASGGSAQASGGVDATLEERQSQYGCYEDVAHVTQQILSVLRIGNYDELPAPMKESLHMIASKMARIVNGDPEYLDNWHDIGGYAKLIEKLIKGE